MSKPRKIQEWECGSLPYDEWVSEYEPGEMLETYGDDYEKVMAMYEEEPNRIWTLLDCDGKLIIGSGWHWVNRMGYYITKGVVPDMVSIEVEDD